MESLKRFSGEKYNVKWNSYKNSIVQYLGDHLAQEELVDVTLACDGRYIKAHKLILSACSPYFKELFQIHKAKNPLIILNNVKFEELNYVINFIYNGEIRVLDSDLEGVLLLGNNLKIKGLSNIKEKNVAKKSDNDSKQSTVEDKQDLEDSVIKNTPKTSSNNDKNSVTKKNKTSKNSTANGSKKTRPSGVQSNFKLGAKSVSKLNSSVSESSDVNRNCNKGENAEDKLQIKRRKLTNILTSMDVQEGSPQDARILSQDGPSPIGQQEIHNVLSQDVPWPTNQQDIHQVLSQDVPLPAIQQDVQNILSRDERLPAIQQDVPKLLSRDVHLPNIQQDVQQKVVSPKPLPALVPEVDDLKYSCKTETELLQVRENSDKIKPVKDSTILAEPRDVVIIRPVSAFMLFATEWRKRLAVEHPNESKKEISVRLGNMWKNLSEETKDTFYEAASRTYEQKRKSEDFKNINHNIKT